MSKRLDDIELRLAVLEREKDSKVLRKSESDYLIKAFNYILRAQKDYSKEHTVSFIGVGISEFKIMMNTLNDIKNKLEIR